MVLEKIRHVYPQLTRSQRKLADFIAGSYQEAAFMTAARLAERLGVNEATVIRFAQRLGYSGYPEMIGDVQSVVQQEIKAPGGVGEAAPGRAYLANLERELESLSRAVSHVTPELAQGLLDLVGHARRICVAGQGISYHLAGVLTASLASLGYDVYLAAGDPESLALAAAYLGDSDAFIGVAAGGESPEVARALDIARERGAQTLAVTSSPTSLAAQSADLALICPHDDLVVGPAVATVAAFLHALVQAAADMEQVDTREFVRRVEGNRQRLRTG